MTHKISSTDLDRISRAVLDSIENLFAECEFDDDAGNIRLLDRNGSCLWLGLFPLDDEGEQRSAKPAAVWAIEVSHDQHEQKGETP
jgi:hypothetical protein